MLFRSRRPVALDQDQNLLELCSHVIWARTMPNLTINTNRKGIVVSEPGTGFSVIYDEGTSDAEIERLRAEVAAEAGVDPANVERWIHRIIVYPPPRR